jgi:hypothetical protein
MMEVQVLLDGLASRTLGSHGNLVWLRPIKHLLPMTFVAEQFFRLMAN